jgi:predicted DNA-binding transcriptional regulator AlpA
MKLLNAKTLASKLQISQRQVWALHYDGQLPAPVRIRRSVRWREDDIDRWIADGCVLRRRTVQP